MNNGNGFLAPALGVWMWQQCWHHRNPGHVPFPRREPGTPISRDYYVKLDNMQWQYPLEDLYAAVWAKATQS